MSEPDLNGDDPVWRSTASNTRPTLHLDPDCVALRQADTIRQERRRQHPHPTWCSRCTGDADVGGGSRELYELAKRAGERREATND